MPALVTNSKIWGEMFGTKEMHFLFSDESTTPVSYTHLTLPTICSV